MAVDVSPRDAQSQVNQSPRQLLIGGEWVESASGRRFDTVNPATGETLAQVAHGQAEDIDRAVAAARAAFESPSWETMKPADRGRIVWRIGDLIEEHADELALLDSLDNGKPLAVARAADVALAAELFRYMAGWATKIEGKTITPSVPYLPDAQFHAYTLHQAVGVVGQVIPWNFPLLMAAWKLGPAIATGCTVVLKPAEQTPLSALRLGELMLEAGLPDGVVNVVTGFGDAGAALAAHPGVDKIAFTGSTEVGRQIVAAASHDLKKVSLELGGKSPNVVFADADLEAAVAGAANAIFFNQGEVCTAGSRLYVQDAAYDTVLDGLSREAQAIRVGPGTDPDSQMGPLVSHEQLTRVEGYVQSGIDEGAEVVAGGRRLRESGYFMAPTILANTNPSMKVVREEIFGPVVTVSPFSSVEEAIRVANDSAYGLGAGVWTRDISKAHRMARAVRAGTVWINTYNVYDAALPFGGFKQSGWGREMGEEALSLYTEVKTVIAQV